VELDVGQGPDGAEATIDSARAESGVSPRRAPPRPVCRSVPAARAL